MRKYSCVLLPLLLVACQQLTRSAAPAPESEQIIGDSLKDLYMAASAAAPQSEKQQKLILKMAEKASNGKEILLVMRASVGVFPPDGRAAEFRRTVTTKMIRVATLDQLSDFATQYAVEPASAREYVERMFQLAGQSQDPRAWHRIVRVASRLKVGDLERQAHAKVTELTAE